jgi:hypothetical protein
MCFFQMCFQFGVEQGPSLPLKCVMATYTALPNSACLHVHPSCNAPKGLPPRRGRAAPRRHRGRAVRGRAAGHRARVAENLPRLLPPQGPRRRNGVRRGRPPRRKPLPRGAVRSGNSRLRAAGTPFGGGSPRQAFRFCNSRSVFRRGHFSMFVWWRLGRQVSILQAAESRLALRAWQLAQQDAQAAPTLCVQGCGHVGRADAIAHHEVRPRCPGRPLP